MEKLKKSFLFFSICFLYLNNINCYSQQNKDSLNIYFELSKNKNKSIDFRLKTINKVLNFAKNQENIGFVLKGYSIKSLLYSQLKKYDSAIVFAKVLLKKSLEINNSTMTLLAYRKLADYHRRNDDLLQSLNFYKKHKKISISNKDTLAIIRNLRFIASIQKTLGSSFESEESAVEALNLANQLKVNNEKIIKIKMGLYNHLGIIYREKSHYNEALKLYNKALLIAVKQKEINIMLNNIANVFLEQHKYILAITEFTKTYKNSLELKDEKQIAKSLNNLSVAQSKINHPDALTNMMKALEIRLKEKDIFGIYSSNIHLAKYYEDRNDTKKVLYHANKAYEIAKKLNSDKDKIEALSFIIGLNNNIQVAEYKKLTDSISKIEQFRANKYASMRYDYTEKEKIAVESELKLKNSKIKQAREKFYKLIYQTIGLILLFTTLFTYFILKSKNKKEKLQQVYVTETRISQKVHDEVANDVFGIITKLQYNESENTAVLDDLERVYIKTRDISKENSIINFTENFSTTLQDLLTSYKNDEVNIITRNLNKIDWHSVSKLKKTAIYRVLQELMTNMKKHSKASSVVIYFNKDHKKTIINYKDNGIGCIVKKNTGLQNTETRIKSVNGSITFESKINKGFKVKISV